MAAAWLAGRMEMSCCRGALHFLRTPPSLPCATCGSGSRVLCEALQCLASQWTEWWRGAAKHALITQ